MAITAGNLRRKNRSLPPVLMIILVIHAWIQVQCYGCIEGERRALLDIKADMYGHQVWLSSWSGQDCCSWRGVGCDNASGHVVKLDLRFPDEYDWSGPSKVNPSLLALTHLEYLDLSMNDFDLVPIPAFIGSLTSLEYLNLSSSWFYGAIPHQLGNLSSLRYLDLKSWEHDMVFLYSDDLRWLTRIHSLTHLDLSWISLAEASHWIHDLNALPSLVTLLLSNVRLQSIPASPPPHVNFTSLASLDLSENNFNSTLPGWLLNLSSLAHLDVSYNDFHGMLPVPTEHSSNLQVLQLSYNEFSSENLEILGSFSRLEQVYLAGNSINGEVPESIGNNHNLTLLDLSENQISGIPKTIEKLSQLKVLDLSGNVISGRIPEPLGKLTHLQQLSLTRNNLSGQIPEALGSLHSLHELHLSNNNIQGPIPSAIGNLCGLRLIALSNNRIEGEITALVEGLSKCSENKGLDGLQYLYLANNNMNGTIPTSLGQFSSLALLDLSANSLEGVLTEAHFSNLKNLDELFLSDNSFEMITSEHWVPPFNAKVIRMCSCKLGPKFPAWLHKQTRLQDLCLSHGGISDNIPDWFWNFSVSGLAFNLSHNRIKGHLPTTLKGKMFGDFDLSSNNLDGPLPNWNFSQFQVINLSNNSFSGPIPSSFSTGVDIGYLILSHNQLNGIFPSFLCNLPSLTVLHLSNNNLSGQLPDQFNKSSQIEVIDLSGNSLSGHIPDSIGYLAQLQSLHLRNNSLTGEIPLSLKDCDRLVTLDLGENRLSGGMPTWIGENLSSLKVLRLRSNKFNGSIPVQLSRLTSLQVLDLAHNNLSGSLSLSFENFTAMIAIQTLNNPILSQDIIRSYYTESLLITAKGQEIEYTTVLSLVISLDLSCNDLVGEIPNEITKLQGLRFLNLSVNHLVGKIPEGIGELRQLESLDLSTNNLSGRIPPTMSELNFLSHLNLSHNNLSGRVPAGEQFQTFGDPSIYNGNRELCGWPLPECPNTEPSHAPLNKGGEDEENGDGAEVIWLYAGSALGFVVGFWAFLGPILFKQTIRIAYFQFIDKFFGFIRS